MASPSRPRFARSRPLVRALSLALALTLILIGARLAHAGGGEVKPEPEAEAGSKPLTFEAHVRPILKAHCFACHGEGDKREGGLDLRLRRLLVAGGESGPAIEPSKPEESDLLDRVRSGEMPPTDKKLSADQVAIIERWIGQGAKTARPEPESASPETLGAFTEEERSYWAFQPIQRPEPPRVKRTDRVRSPIDAFLLTKLEEKGLEFAPDADRRTLIRRASMDLLGLPPSPSEIDAFLADNAPDAYERLIDRLLARPEYGERWARHWLDLAGYADSDGHSAKDPVRPYAYKYRDYVIRSLNDDKPLDQFLREQLAGDEMIAKTDLRDFSERETELLIATGFLRMAPDGTSDRETDQKVARNQVVSDTIKIVSTAFLGITVQCAECHNHRYDPVTQVDYYRMRAIFEPALDWRKWKAPGERLVSLLTTADRAKAQELETEAAKVDQRRTALAQEFINKTFEEEVAKLPEAIREPIRAAFKTPAAQRTEAQKRLLEEHPSVNVSSGSLYLYDERRFAAIRGLESKIKKAERDLAQKAEPALKTEIEGLKAQVETIRASYAKDRLDALTKEAAEIRGRKPKEDFVHALTEPAFSAAPATHLFHRGDFQQPKQVVGPGEPAIIGANFEGPSESAFKPESEPKPAKAAKLPTTGRRLSWAKRLTDGMHPLTGRVLANRIWMHHFGRGIVGTPGDLGALGERPTHPELLDWLARELMDQGWGLKRFHKLLMTSTAYRQQSSKRPELETADPDNRLLGRMNVRRLEAEALRDSILSVSGKLSSKRHGPPVPVAPDESGQIIIGSDSRDEAGRPKAQVGSLGEEAHRRSIYIQVRRTMPLGTLEAFDAPSMATNCQCEARPVSTAATQSLILLNNSFLVEQAESFADRLAKESPDLGRQIETAWRLAYGRSPSDRERAEALDFLREQTANFASAPPDRKAKRPADRQALADFCQAILSGNEFLYVD